MSRECQMDVSRESTMSRGCQEGVKDSEIVQRVLRGCKTYVKSCERVSRVVLEDVEGMSRGCQGDVKRVSRVVKRVSRVVKRVLRVVKRVA